jgi:hypothetical protein
VLDSIKSKARAAESQKLSLWCESVRRLAGKLQLVAGVRLYPLAGEVPVKPSAIIAVLVVLLAVTMVCAQMIGHRPGEARGVIFWGIFSGPRQGRQPPGRTR